jgi:hypothetical protein
MNTTPIGVVFSIGGVNMSYEVVLRDNYYLRELIQSITLSDSLDEIAYRANIGMVVTEDLQRIGISPADEIRISGIPLGDSQMRYLLHPAVVWTVPSVQSGMKTLDAVVYDRTIYLAKSDDEDLHLAGLTASQRILKYCDRWNIPIANLPDTGIPLAQSKYSAQSIYSMMRSDLQKSAKKGGKLYRPRMTPTGFELFEIGSNPNPYVFELQNGTVISIAQNRTLEDAVTRVKVTGATSDENTLAQPLAIVDGQTSLGTLQRVVSSSDVTTTEQAKSLANDLLEGITETFRVDALDVNTIRAGDKVIVNGIDLIVMSITHNLGVAGTMSMELASLAYVRKRMIER